MAGNQENHGALQTHDVRDEGDDSTSELVHSTISHIVAGLTGIAASDKRDVILSFGHILQRTRSVGFLDAFKNEWDNYRRKGRIKEDYLATEQHVACLQELLDSLDSDSPDDARFSILKKIILTAGTEEVTDRTSTLPHQYMKIARSLSSGEILVLFAAYRYRPEKGNPRNSDSAVVWLATIAKEAGLEFPELVEKHEERLIGKYLLTRRLHDDRSGIRIGKHNRLTMLGFAFCSFVETYERDS